MGLKSFAQLRRSWLDVQLGLRMRVPVSCLRGRSSRSKRASIGAEPDSAVSSPRVRRASQGWTARWVIGWRSRDGRKDSERPTDAS